MSIEEEEHGRLGDPKPGEMRVEITEGNSRVITTDSETGGQKTVDRADTWDLVYENCVAWGLHRSFFLIETDKGLTGFPIARVCSFVAAPNVKRKPYEYEDLDFSHRLDEASSR